VQVASHLLAVLAIGLAIIYDVWTDLFIIALSATKLALSIVFYQFEKATPEYLT
jgi:hypothetical protein